MPELDLDHRQRRRLEIHEQNTDEWKAWTVERYAIDGRVRLRNVTNPAYYEWVDLSTKRYRWNF